MRGRSSPAAEASTASPSSSPRSAEPLDDPGDAMSNPAEAAPSTVATIPVEVPLVEASVADLRDALEAGRITSVELVAASLNRIARYDRHGLALNAVPVLDPTALDQARASDERRAAGRLLGPLDGIPYTAKDSY